jgi:hypothetical protein
MVDDWLAEAVKTVKIPPNPKVEYILDDSMTRLFHKIVFGLGLADNLAR